MSKREDVQKLLGEPVLHDFSENTLRIRRNLFLASSIVLVYKLGGLRITEGQIAGIKIENLSPELLDKCLFWIVTYLLIHFVWNAWTSFQEWLIRLTGSRVSIII